MSRSIQEILAQLSSEDRIVLEHNLLGKKIEGTPSLEEDRFRLALEASGDGVFDWNLKDNTIYYSPGWKSMLGYKDQEIKNEISEWERLTHSEDAKESRALLNDCLNKKRNQFDVDFRMKHKDGHWVYVHSRGNVFFDSNEEPSRLVGVHVDVTPRKHAEFELKENQSLMSTLINSMPDIVCFKDGKGQWAMANDFARSVFQLDQMDYIGKDDRYLAEHSKINKEAFTACLMSDKEAWENSTLWRGEEVVNLESGGFKVFDIIKVPIFEQDGSRKGMLIIGRDITEIKNAETLLKSEKERVQQYLDAAGITLVLDTEGNVTLSNKKACKTLGYSESEMLGKNWFDDFIPERLKNEVKHVSVNVLAGKVEPFEYFENPVLTSSGEEKWIAWHNNIIRDEKGHIVCTLSTGEDITDRKLAEEELIKSEEKFRRVVSNSDAVIFILDKDGRFTLSEGKALAKIGLRPGEVVGMDSREVYKNNPSVIDAVTASLNGERVQTFLIVENVEFNVLFNPVFDDNGSLEHVVGIATDISDQKLAEKALKFSETRYRTFFEKGHDGVVVIDPETRTFCEFNEQVCRQLGYTSEEFSTLTINDIDATESVSETKKRVTRVLEEKFDAFEVVQRTKQGELRNVLVTAQVMIVEGSPYYHCIWRDITEQKKAEEALKASEENYRLIVENQKDLVVKVDLEGRFLFISPSYCKMFGKTEEELLGKAFMPLVHEEDRQHTEKQMEDLYRPPFSCYIEQRAMTKDGWRWLAWQDTAMLDEAGEVESIIGVGRDITDKKHSEKMILENQRLGAISEMSSAVAHDFNNALQSIFGNLELCLLNPDLPESAVSYLKAIKTASEDAATRVQMLQRFGGKKKGESAYRPVNLNTVIKDVIDQSRPLWKNRAERDGLVFDIQATLTEIPKVSGNDGELRSVMFNVLKNAIEAMPEGGLIEISATLKEDFVNITIKDSGVGMDSETASRIFQPFFSTKGFEMGRGFGMSSVYTIVKEHGGMVDVLNSVPGEGTTIEISFPVIKASEHLMLENEPGTATLAGSILWVDDEPHIRKIAEKFLALMGHEGDVVSSGEDALERLKKKTYDLVITDIGMPGMNGWQLAEHVRDMFHGKMKVAVITGWGAQIESEKKQKFSVGYVLGKPVKYEEVKNLIQEALQN